MSTIKKIVFGLVAASLFTAPMSVAFAAESASANGEQSEQYETTAMTAAKVQMSEAIARAEAAVGGKAVDTGFQQDGAKPAWEIKIAQADGTTKTVLVDAATGQVDQNPAMDHQNDEGSENGEEVE